MKDKDYNEDLEDEALVNLLNDEDVMIKGAQNVDFNA